MSETISAALLLAFIEVESSFDPRAFRRDENGGSRGLGQIDMPTAKWAGYTGSPGDLYEPRTNIRLIGKILGKIAADLLDHGKWSLPNLAAAYNSGLQHVLDGGTDKAYSMKILAAYGFWSAATAVESPAIVWG